MGWASNNVADRNYQQFHIKKDPTAQIHVTFLCPLDMYPITEEKLRNIFERFGGIIDVTINRVECNQVSAHSPWIVKFFLILPVRRVLFILVMDLFIILSQKLVSMPLLLQFKP